MLNGRSAAASILIAWPLLAQSYITRTAYMTPWLRGEPEGTQRLITQGSAGGGILWVRALRCGAEFEIERGHYIQARQILDRIKHIDEGDLLRPREAKFRAATGDFLGAEKVVLKGKAWDGRDVDRLKVSQSMSLNALAEAYAARGLHEQAIRILEKSLDEAHEASAAAEWADAKVLTAFSHMALGRTDDALLGAEAALAFSRRKWGDVGPRTLDAADVLGVVLMAQGKYEEAGQWLSLALRCRQALYQHAHIKSAASYLHYGQLLAAQKKHDKAIEFADAAVRIMKAALPNPNARTALFLAQVSEIYDRSVNTTQAR